uniref:Uncharacterized protein n=1 Tax=Anopheles albimanus TaxID=7167 RepID=A0A182FX74_ANOAL
MIANCSSSGSSS